MSATNGVSCGSRGLWRCLPGGGGVGSRVTHQIAAMTATSAMGTAMVTMVSIGLTSWCFRWLAKASVWCLRHRPRPSSVVHRVR